MLPTFLTSLWFEKYRPKTLDQFIFQNSHHNKIFKDMVTSKSIPHILLTGSPGTGKTALSSILINACIDPDDVDIDVLKVNASDNNSVDDVRNEIYSHITSMGNGSFKVVWLEEADYLSLNAQGILRDYMETYQQECRFIITCNNVHKIIPAIKSRCQQFHFTGCNKDDVMEMVAVMLMKEKITCDIPTLTQHVDIHYPDMRSIINSIEQYSKSGILLNPDTNTPMQSAKLEIIELIQSDSWSTLRQKLCSTVSDEEWVEVYTLLYQHLNSSPKFGNVELWEQGIVLIAEHLFNHPQCAKPNINAASLLIQLGSIG